MYKAKNILEDTDYALKKIVINTEKKSAKKIKLELENQLNEIKILSKLKNQNIVEYVQSWVEVEIKESLKKKKDLSFDTKISFDSSFEDLGRKEKSLVNDDEIFIQGVVYKYIINK